MIRLLALFFLLFSASLHADILTLTTNFFGSVVENVTDTALEGEVDVLNSDNLFIGLSGKEELLSLSDLRHEPLRYAYVMENQKERRKWHHYTIAAEAALPVSIPVEFEELTTLAVGADAALGRKYQYEYFVNSAIDIGRMRVLDRSSRTYRVVKTIRPFSNLSKTAARYAPGFEMKKSGEYYVRSGLSVTEKVLTEFSFRESKITKAPTEMSLKLIRARPIPLWEFVLTQGKSVESSLEFGIGKSYDIAKFYFLKFKLGYKVFTISSARGESEVDRYRFLVEEKSPVVTEALEKAFKGDLLPLQKLAVFRTGDENYQGVLTLEEEHSFNDQTSLLKKLGLSVSGGILGSLLRITKIQKLIEEFFLLSGRHQKVSHISGTKKSYGEFILKTENNALYASRGVLLWKLGYNEKFEGAIKVSTQKVFNEYSGISEREQLAVKYSASLEGRAFPRSLAWRSLPVLKTLFEVPRCVKSLEKQYPFIAKLGTTITENSFKEFSHYSIEDFWKIFGEFVGYKKSQRLADPEFRRELFKINLGGRARANPLSRMLMPSEQIYYFEKAVQSDLFHDLKKLPLLGSRVEEAALLSEIFSKWNGDYFLILFFNKLLSLKTHKTDSMIADFQYESAICKFDKHATW